MLKVAVCLGTRPEIIKMSPIIRALIDEKIEYFILHSGQHYSYNMDKLFFEELNLPAPKYNLNVGSGTHASMTAKIMEESEKIFLDEKPTHVFVQGDTNTVLGCSMGAFKIEGIKLCHVEAGLRSNLWYMPEEKNRVIVDHISDILFAPTKESVKLLKKEGIPSKRIFLTGNTIVDATIQNIKLKDETETLSKFNLEKKKFIIVTVHRQENVDNKNSLLSISNAINELSNDYTILWPIHPRTKERIKEFNIIINKSIKIVEPIGYLDFLNLIKNASLVLTDSGGLQEESCILKTPCVTLRENTERPETLKAGSNMLSKLDKKKIIKTVNVMIKRKPRWKNPFGDGFAAKKIINILKSERKS
ncbi:UDP-N-acetylglucosamine 2-epimerase [Candidatus Tiddalikarchaeum anstoanum]|nr:UDP-N-acetylglucosamine 2-epimerase [Candidatus Tiddalikarchaeum anstoanum]